MLSLCHNWTRLQISLILLTMKLILNPKYEYLREYLTHLEEHFENEGVEIHRDRNVIRTLQVGELTLCVKRYEEPSLKRRLQQMVYKDCKSKQAYISPLLLRERGFESPESVAYVRFYHGLKDSTDYFVCLHSAYRYNMATLAEEPAEIQNEVIMAFARYVAHLHEGGFLHRDFSSSNILYDKIGDRYHFSLVDTNSMKCGRAVSIEEGCRNLAQLSGDDRFFEMLTQYYAEGRNTDVAKCRTLINAARRKSL